MSAPRGWIWREDVVKDTPSFRRGMSGIEEARQRRLGARVLVDIGPALKLKVNPTLATACVYFHRFYMFHTFEQFPREITALACLLLAGKLEETPKKCKDICLVAQQKYPSALGQPRFPSTLDLADEVMGVERVLLRTLKFDLQVEHPYKYLAEYCKAIKLPNEEATDVFKFAWTFTNDSYATTMCLLYEPQVIAVAVLSLGLKFKYNNTVPDNVPSNWWDQFIGNLSVNLLEEMCSQMQDFYALMDADGIDSQQVVQPTANTTARTG